MKGWDNQLTILLLVASNLVAILQLIASLRWPPHRETIVFLLFSWAAWTTKSQLLRNSWTGSSLLYGCLRTIASRYSHIL